MNLQWAKEFMNSFTGNNLEKAMGLYTDNVQFEDVTLGFMANGKAELREFFKGFTDPNAGENKFTTTAYSGSAEGGAVEWLWEAKHVGEFMGAAAAGKETQVKGVSILTFKGGKIESQHDYWDASSVLRQLGAIK